MLVFCAFQIYKKKRKKMNKQNKLYDEDDDYNYY